FIFYLCFIISTNVKIAYLSLHDALPISSRGFPSSVPKGHALSPSRKLHTWGAVVWTSPLCGTASKRTRGPRSHTGPRRLRMSQGRDFIRPRMLRLAHDGSTPGHPCVPVSTPGRGAMGEFLAEIKVRINETYQSLESARAAGDDFLADTHASELEDLYRLADRNGVDTRA